MDRGLGLFAGLNVLPKAAWLTSYSHRVTREMNLQLLRGLHGLWQSQGFLSDTANLDFTTLPYWGEAKHLENNWSGTRHQALSSILAVLAQDPDSGIITYGDTNIRHDKKNQVVMYAPPLQKGDIFFWGSRIIHGSTTGTNTNLRRRSIAAHFVPDGFGIGNLEIDFKLPFKEKYGLIYVDYSLDKIFENINNCLSAS